MDRFDMERILVEVEDDPLSFGDGELGFIYGLIDGYASACRRSLRDRRKVLGSQIQEVENRLKVADALRLKIATLLAKNGDSNVG